jgi:DNA polymerase (family X)
MPARDRYVFMVDNKTIADMFEEIADLLALGNANPFRVRAYRNGARTVRRYGEPMSKLVAQEVDLTKLPAIGKDLSALIEEAVNTGQMRSLEALHASAPAAAGVFLQVEGIGPKKARALLEHLGVTTLEELHRAALDQRVRSVPGFGPLSEAKLIEALSGMSETTGSRWPIGAAQPVARAAETRMRSCKAILALEVAGSYRRGNDTIGDLDLVAASNTPVAAISTLTDWDNVARVVSAGERKATVILKNGMQIDLRVCTPGSWGAMLHYFTGSKSHSIALRTLARQRGLKLNEYGVWNGRNCLAAATEEDIYRALGLNYIPPELRENQGEIELAARGALPTLVDIRNLKGDLHALVDGPDSAREIIEAAAERGFSYLGVGPHVSSAGARGAISGRALKQLFADIEAVAARHDGLEVLKVVEADIDAKGILDLPPDVACYADIVVGSAQDAFHLSRTEQTDRLLAALTNPSLTILSHPTGRLVARRKPYDVDMIQIAEAAANEGVALELSADPDRLDLTDRQCRIAKTAGAKVSISAEARRAEDFGRLSLGISQARRGWLEPGDILNTLSLPKIRAFASRRKPDASGTETAL